MRWGAAAFAVALAASVRGAVLLNSPAPAVPTAKVALVQASESHRSTSAEVVCISRPEEYDPRTREAMERGAELVLWPEATAAQDMTRQPGAARRAIPLLGTRTHLLTGTFAVDPVSGGTTNSAALLSPSGELLGRYDKVLIVPFGEYLPLRPWLRWTTRLGMPETDLTAGTRFTPLDWPRGRIGVSICFESTFGLVSREAVQQGAVLLAVLTSDGWNGRGSVGLQHLAFAPLRAVENRRAVARAAATGVSQLIDPFGRVLAEVPMFSKGVAMADLPLRTDQTPYSRFGEWPVLLSIVILAAAALRGAAWRKKLADRP